MAIVVLMFILSIAFLYYKNKKYFKKIEELKASGLANFESGNLENINWKICLSEQAENLPYDRDYEFPVEKLQLKERLGEGHFGVVMKAVATGIDKHAGEKETVVAVKTINKHAGNEMLKALISELKIMIHLGQHLNVMNLLGAVTKNIAKRQLMVICEFCEYGNLSDFLQKNRENFKNLIVDDEVKFCDDDLHKITTVFQERVAPSGYVQFHRVEPLIVFHIDSVNLISWACQIARGMEYLASNRVLHGDLAARNILLCEGNVVKICDFGLAKSLYKNYSYKRSEETPLPFKWLSLESMTDGVFSVHSDVWSYGE